MKRTSLIIALLLFGLNMYADTGSEIKTLMNELDDVISTRDSFIRIKENRIDSLARQLSLAENDEDRFIISGRLFDEYCSFNTDSAYSISLRREQIARQMNDSNLILNALLNQGNALNDAGMYAEVIELLRRVPRTSLPDYLLPYYYHLKRTLYGRMADFAAFEPSKKIYRRLTESYRDSLLSINEPGTLPYIITEADKLNSNGNPAKAIDVLQSYLDNNEVSTHEQAYTAWTLAQSYNLTGDTDNLKKQLLISSIHDLKGAVREYISLRELALLLYREGDLDRAYRFMTIAIDDATKCNARQRIIETSESYPMINSIYVDKIKSQQTKLVWLLAVITLLSLFLLAALIYVRKQMKRIAKARQTIEDTNTQLNDLNRQLTQTNENLQAANLSIAENSRLKEVYIGRYMDQCIEYIERLDSFRKSIGKLVSTGQSDELKKALKSTAAIENELKNFYDNFDKTFLKLFPNFVKDFNALLQPDEAIVPKSSDSLTTELRIFALIRLGITDSDRIAKFLRYSVTTIYNYRTRVRNKALNDRNRLDEEVMRLSPFSN